MGRLSQILVGECNLLGDSVAEWLRAWVVASDFLGS